MKISIVTVAYNSAQTIKDTIDSVARQSYKNIEHIIVDGGSTDGTVGIISSYPFVKMIGGPDRGIYDAMNKGLRLASGDVVAFLNSDDFFEHDRVIERVAREFFVNEIDFLYGDVVMVSPDNTERVVRLWEAGVLTLDSFRRGWHPPHPAMFVKKSVFEEIGAFSEKYRIAGDYEFILRLFARQKFSFSYVNEVLVRMRLGGVSNGGLGNIVIGNLECLEAWRDNNLPVPWFLIVVKPGRKLGQYWAGIRRRLEKMARG